MKEMDKATVLSKRNQDVLAGLNKASSLATCLGQCDWCGIEPHAVANLLTRMPLSGKLSSHASTTRRLLLYQRLSS